MRDLAWFVWLLPRNAGVLLIRAYRAVVSPLYGDVCRYYPSCSAYGLGAVQHRGLVLGSVLTGWRILRCNPWSAGGIDDVPLPKVRRFHVTRFGFVVPAAWAADGSAAGRRRARRGRRRAVRAHDRLPHPHPHPHPHDHAHPRQPASASASLAGRAAEGSTVRSDALAADTSRDDAGHELLSPIASRKD